jgi:hypothetical protein
VSAFPDLEDRLQKIYDSKPTEEDFQYFVALAAR